jgi:hypothetical protein
MSNRVLVGKRGSDYGLFVSKPGEDVEDAADATNLSFDSRSVGSLFTAGGTTPLRGEGSLAAPTSGYQQGTISHSLGYIPAYAVRWCYASDLDGSNIAQRMYNPSNIVSSKTTISGGTYYDTATGGIDCLMTDEYLFLFNWEAGIDHSSLEGTADVAAQIIYYAYLIFQTPDFTGGFSL